MASSSSSSLICLASVHNFSKRSRLFHKQDTLFFNHSLNGTLKNYRFVLKPCAVATPSASSILTEEAFKDLVTGFSDDKNLTSDFSDDDSFNDPRGAQTEQNRRLSAGGKDELAVCNLGLPKLLVESLERRGITHLFPIQRAVLLPALEGQDLIARAKTGTGKTLAFGIPIIKRLTEADANRSLQRRSGRLPRVLVLAPTRELARQVEKEIKESAPYLNTVCVYGGVSYVQQKSALQHGVDVVVGTPGRIIDLIDSNHLKLGEVQFLVLDEADQMLAVGFEEHVEIILESLPSKRQSMLFSATMPTWVKKLSRKYLDNPLNIDLVGDHDEKLAEGIKLYAVAAASSNSKRDILPNLIATYAKGGKTIVFTHTKREADEVARMLTYCIPSEALHGDKSQFQREKTLGRFRQGRFSVLVATDVASRGLDIPNVDLVIHYELPNDAEIFVHRSGRTGRAGKEGTAIVMFTNSQKRTVKSFERDAGCRFDFISSGALPTFSGIYSGSRQLFTPDSQDSIREQEPDRLAAVMAQLNDFSSPSSSRSLITHEQGWMTLQLTRDLSYSDGFLSARSVMGFLSEVYSPAADEVGKICIIADEMVYGAVFDLPENTARELLNQQLPSGNYISAIKKLPILQDVGPRRGERFGNKMARGGPRGEARERRGSSMPGGWGSSRNSDDQDRYGRGSRNSRAENSWSGNRRSNTDDWLISGRRSPSQAGSRDRGSFGSSFGSSFGGSCFVCGRSGHKATECPNKQEY